MAKSTEPNPPNYPTDSAPPGHFHYAQYSDNCPNRLAVMSAELIAQDEGLGVWAVAGMVPPWEWRQQRD